MAIKGDEKELSENLKIFIHKLSEDNRPQKHLIEIGLSLLEVYPESQRAVLGYFSRIYETGFRDYVYKFKTLSKEQINYNSPNITSIGESLIELVGFSSSALSSVISQWCVNNFEQIIKYMSFKNSELEEREDIFKYWTLCPVTHSLLSLMCSCFSNLNDDEIFICIDSLLNSIAFDPIVFVWILKSDKCTGPRFHVKIINYLLDYVLEDYYRINKFIQFVPKQRPVPKIRKELLCEEEIIRRRSAVFKDILDYFSMDRKDEMKEIIVALFMKSINECETNDRIEPSFILHELLSNESLLSLCSLTVTSVFEVISNSSVDLHKLVEKVKLCIKFNYINYQEAIEKILTILMHSECPAFEIINFFVKNAVMDERENTKTNEMFEISREIMNLLCSKMQREVLNSSSGKTVIIRIIKSLRDHIDELCILLMKTKDIRKKWWFKILACLCMGDSRATAAKILSNVFLMVSNTNELSTFLELQKCSENKHDRIITHFMDNVFHSLQDSNIRPQNIRKILNLFTLETSSKIVSRHKILFQRQTLYKALQTRHFQLILFFRSANFETKLDLLKLLNSLGPPQSDDDYTFMKLAKEAVGLFFCILRQYDGAEKLSLVYDYMKYLKTLISNKSIQMSIIVLILEHALSTQNIELFGGVENVNKLKIDSKWMEPLFSNPNLMEQNRSISGSSLTGKHFHSGEFSNKSKKLKASDPTPTIRQNYRLILETIMSCGCLFFPQKAPFLREEKHCTKDVFTVLSSILIDSVMIDNLFNSVHWPDEDFLKASAERNLHVVKKFEENPLLWHLLDLVVTSPLHSWSCLCILRSLLAYLIVKWESTREINSESLPELLSLTQKVVKYLTDMEVLLEPLSFTIELLPIVSCYEVYLLLINIWRYIFQYNPQTGLKKEFACSPKILDVVQSIMTNNIESCAHLFPLIFTSQS